MDGLIARIKDLNLEVIVLNNQFNKQMDNNFFSDDKAADEKAYLLINEIKEKIQEIYHCCYGIHNQLGGSLQDTLDVIWDYDGVKIHTMEDLDLDFEDLVFEDDII